MSAIDALIEHFGSVSEAAHGLRLDRGTIEHWVRKGFIPFHRGNLVEEATGGKITADYVWRCAAAARHHSTYKQ